MCELDDWEYVPNKDTVYFPVNVWVRLARGEYAPDLATGKYDGPKFGAVEATEGKVGTIAT